MSFHLFRDLPTELQDHIWSLAVRPLSGDRHLHEFIIADQHFDKPSGANEIQANFLRFKPGGELGTGWGLAVPRSPNTSAYKLDSGLWMACRQSRRALERHFHKNEWWSDLPDSDCPPRLAERGDYIGHSDASRTASYIDNDDKAHHITISSGDLIHLAELDPKSVEWFYYIDNIERDTCLNNHTLNGGYRPTSSFIGSNVAISFDPRWNARSSYLLSYETIPMVSSIIKLLNSDADRKLWFIDKRLCRRASKSRGTDISGSAGASELCLQSNNRQKFYSSGYVFTEVRGRDRLLWKIKDQGNVTQLVNGTTSIFAFFRDLILCWGEHLETKKYRWDRFGVLACEISP